MEFCQATEILRQLGVEFHQDHDYGLHGTEKRHEFKVPIITGLRLPFTPEQWCQLCMCDGSFYIGGCCGTTSSAQDIVNMVFRDSGLIKCHDLNDLAEILGGHDAFTDKGIWFDEIESIDVAIQKWGDLNPWELMAVLWHLVKDCYNVKIPHGSHPNNPKIKTALFVLSDVARQLSWEQLFDSKCSGGKEFSSQFKANQAIRLSRLIPALHELWHNIDTLNLGVVEGYAIIVRELGPESIAINGYGYCIYETKEEVDHMIDTWRKQEAEYEERNKRRLPLDERIGIRQVRVSKERGIEFLDEVKP